MGSIGEPRPEDGNDFHLKVRPQSKPPRTRGDPVYC
jgi:hypothetical protein